jgi:hypothetical protein
MKRLVLTVLVVLSLTATRRAHAQSGSDGSLPGSATLNFNYEYFHECNGSGSNMPYQGTVSQGYYTNFAHCECSRLYTPVTNNETGDTTPAGAPPAGGFPAVNEDGCTGSAKDTWYEGAFAYQILLENQTTPLIEAPLQIWVGESCDDPIMRPMLCHQVNMDPSDGIPYIATIATTNGIYPLVSTYELMEPEPSTAVLNGPLKNYCEQRSLTTAEWGISNVNPDGTIGSSPQYFVSQGITTDSLAPPYPQTFTAYGADSAIQLGWTAPTGNVADIQYYQALCSDMSGNPAAGVKPPAPRYQTPYTLCHAPEPLQPCTEGSATSLCYSYGCVTNAQPTFVDGSTSPIALTAIDAPIDSAIDASDASVDAGQEQITCTTTNNLTPPSSLLNLDSSFICGEVDDATATSMRITGLTNGTPYMVMLVTIDLYGNPSPVLLNEVMTPEPVNDVWDDLNERGSQVQGGFCLIAETFGDDNPLTQALRGFRDDNLSASWLGRVLVEGYYGSLAKLGAYVHGNLALRIVSGVLLAPLIALALAWHALTLPGLLVVLVLGVFARRWLRRRRKHATRVLGLVRPLATAAALLVALAPGRAHAQQPYWDSDRTPSASSTGKDEETSLADEPQVETWRLALGIGPYMPQIDAQFKSQTGYTGLGPYREMFGSSDTWVPALTFERVVFRKYGGQWLAGINGGYLQTSAHAWEICNAGGMVIVGCNDTPGSPDRSRSPGDSNTFHLIPLALTASYRFTRLDDEYGVPIVPYGRVGGSYYIWWIDGPNGGVSDYKGNHADGASLGLQGTVGISIRAERIDADAARSMRDTGILHAGFFGEVTSAWVDGFGSSHKLDVGDTTWFAGIDFEF